MQFNKKNSNICLELQIASNEVFYQARLITEKYNKTPEEKDYICLNRTHVIDLLTSIDALQNSCEKIIHELNLVQHAYNTSILNLKLQNLVYEEYIELENLRKKAISGDGDLEAFKTKLTEYTDGLD